MIECDFKLVGDGTPIGSQQVNALLGIGDKVTIDGQPYVVEQAPRYTSPGTHIIWVRKATKGEKARSDEAT